MSQKAYVEFTCDGCALQIRRPHDLNPQHPRQRLPANWGAVVIENETRHELCEGCMSKVRCALGPSGIAVSEDSEEEDCGIAVSEDSEEED